MTEDLKKLETRLAKVEQELVMLRKSVGEPHVDEGRPWWQKIAGRFSGDPAFAEIVRLGEKIRKADRPKKRRR
ncbi:MAG TPA: hypothetical protein VL475_04410 [Planctomycetaceae bacterium]|nr:hypothetical protein [Planctomycetaceae bacterium]